MIWLLFRFNSNSQNCHVVITTKLEHLIKCDHSTKEYTSHSKATQSLLKVEASKQVIQSQR